MKQSRIQDFIVDTLGDNGNDTAKCADIIAEEFLRRQDEEIFTLIERNLREQKALLRDFAKYVGECLTAYASTYDGETKEAIKSLKNQIPVYLKMFTKQKAECER